MQKVTVRLVQLVTENGFSERGVTALLGVPSEDYLLSPRRDNGFTPSGGDGFPS
jgi:hypothetical protein